MKEPTSNLSATSPGFPAVILSVVLVSLSLAQLAFVLHYSVNVIFMDQFHYVSLLTNFDWHHLFAQYSAHRLVIPRLFSCFSPG